MSKQRRIALRNAFLAIITLLCFCFSTARADDTSNGIQAARDYINAVRSLDAARVKALYQRPANDGEKQLDATIHYWIEIQKLRLLAEDKFGPEPDFSEEVEGWNWGVPPESIVDHALKNYPDCVQIENGLATVMIPPGFVFKKVDGRWLAVLEDSSNELTEKLAERLPRLAEIEADLRSGKIKTITETQDRITRALWTEE
ncbi:MAG TPA: hypothetical protein PK402_02035 [Tepidisphaeraceae bacterium]|nr:hypothetical protein [Tepidisphaeraceae bacterium]